MARKQPAEQVSGRFSVIPHAVLDSAAFMGASHHARSLLFELMRQHTGKNNGHFQLAKQWLYGRGWNSSAIIQGAKAELLHRQLAIKTRLGGMNIGPDLWAVTWLVISDYSKLTEVSANTYHPGAWHFMGEAIPLAVKHSRETSFDQTTGRTASVPPGGLVTPSPVPPGGTVTALLGSSPVPPGGHNEVTSSPRRNVARRVVGKPRASVSATTAAPAIDPPEIDTQQAISPWQGKGAPDGAKSPPRAAIEVLEGAGDTCRIPDDAPAEFWDSDLGEFRPDPHQKRRATLLVETPR